jgi:hypothetical protein
MTQLTVHREGPQVTDVATIEDAYKAIKAAIAELKAAGIDVPMALYRAAHALSYEIEARRKP